MANNATQNQAKLPAVDNQRCNGYIAGSRHGSVMLSRGFSVLLGDRSLRYSRIWTGKHIPGSGHGSAHGKLINCTLEQRDTSFVHQSFQ